MSNKTYPLQKTGSKVEELLHKIDVLSKDDIDLDQVDNTSDINKPVSNLQRQALNMILEEAKAYTNNEIAEFDFIKIVSVLPNEGLPNRIYLVPKTEIEEQNLFDEYLWVNNLWEWIATKSIDVDLTNIYTKNEINDLLEFKVDKVDGYSLMSDDEIERLADVDNYDDAEVRKLIGDNADAIEAINDKIGEVADNKTIIEIIADAKREATYDDTQIKTNIKANTDAIDAIEADYLKATDKIELEGKITENVNALIRQAILDSWEEEV